MEQSDEIFLHVMRNRSAMLGFILALVPNFSDAEDILQETVVEILRCRDRYDRTREFLPWAFGVAKNTVRVHYRKAARAPQAVSDEVLETLADCMQEQPDAPVWEEEKTLLRKCMERLSAANRNLLMLRYGRNLKGPALARESGRVEGSLRTTLLRLRAALRDCIAKGLPPNPQEGSAHGSL